MSDISISTAESLVAPVSWFGAQDSRVVALRPFDNQGGLVTTWAEAFPALSKKRGALLESIVTRMLIAGSPFAHETPDGFSLEIDKWANVRFGRTHDFVRWMGDAAGLALVSCKNEQSRWALLGVSREVCLGAYAAEVPCDTAACSSVPSELCTPVQLSVAPLRTEYAAQLRAAV